MTSVNNERKRTLRGDRDRRIRRRRRQRRRDGDDHKLAREFVISNKYKTISLPRGATSLIDLMRRMESSFGEEDGEFGDTKDVSPTIVSRHESESYNSNWDDDENSVNASYFDDEEANNYNDDGFYSGILTDREGDGRSAGKEGEEVEGGNVIEADYFGNKARPGRRNFATGSHIFIGSSRYIHSTQPMFLKRIVRLGQSKLEKVLLSDMVKRLNLYYLIVQEERTKRICSIYDKNFAPPSSGGICEELPSSTSSSLSLMRRKIVQEEVEDEFVQHLVNILDDANFVPLSSGFMRFAREQSFKFTLKAEVEWSQLDGDFLSRYLLLQQQLNRRIIKREGTTATLDHEAFPYQTKPDVDEEEEEEEEEENQRSRGGERAEEDRGRLENHRCVVGDDSEDDGKEQGRTDTDHNDDDKEQQVPEFARYCFIFWRGVHIHRESGFYLREKADLLFRKLTGSLSGLSFLYKGREGFTNKLSSVSLAGSNSDNKREEEERVSSSSPSPSFPKPTAVSVPGDVPGLYNRRTIQDDVKEHGLMSLFRESHLEEVCFDEVVTISRPKSTKEIDIIRHNSLALADLEAVLPLKVSHSWADYIILALNGIFVLSFTFGVLVQRPMVTSLLFYIFRRVFMHYLKTNLSRRRAEAFLTGHTKSTRSNQVAELSHISRAAKEQQVMQLALVYSMLWRQGGRALDPTSCNRSFQYSAVARMCKRFLDDGDDHMCRHSNGPYRHHRKTRNRSCCIEIDVHTAVRKLQALGLVEIIDRKEEDPLHEDDSNSVDPPGTPPRNAFLAQNKNSGRFGKNIIMTRMPLPPGTPPNREKRSSSRSSRTTNKEGVVASFVDDLTCNPTIDNEDDHIPAGSPCVSVLGLEDEKTRVRAVDLLSASQRIHEVLTKYV
mmetsp:Transcript_3711/g.5883  ORF Transcript_3711/g.5883 Transcript_3711/m.5883 type:complete len:892 (+) Transcript_3711:288-2963(+)